jgi:hypothetical protein
MGENMNAYKILVGKPEGRRPPGTLGRDFTNLAQNKNQLWDLVPQNALNLLTLREVLGSNLSRDTGYCG